MGDDEGWARDLEERGLERVDGSASPDVWVAAGADAGAAIAGGAPAVVVDRPRAASGELEAAGYATARVLPLPVAGTPVPCSSTSAASD